MHRRRVVTLDEVHISRSGDTAIIRFLDEGLSTVHLRVGNTLRNMSDAEIVEAYNDGVIAQQMLAEEEYVAIEVPQGEPQIAYDEDAGQWAPRGDVLRCLIDDGGPGHQPIIQVDDQALSLEEFGRLLTMHAGWGMRLCFVPADEVETRPRVEIRKP